MAHTRLTMQCRHGRREESTYRLGTQIIGSVTHLLTALKGKCTCNHNLFSQFPATIELVNICEYNKDDLRCPHRKTNEHNYCL